MTTMTLEETLEQLKALGTDKMRTQNSKHGAGDNQFGVRRGDIRVLAKKIKTGHELGQKLWKTGNMGAQLLAILIMKPKELSAEQLDTMVREARFAWVADWLQSYIIKSQPDGEKKKKLREKWMKKSEKDSWAARAGWHLTASKINNGEDGVDVEALLDRIEKEMPRAKPETKWTMNNTLAAIGIKHARHRKRAIAIGEKIGLYEDWPVSKGCTIPYVPVRIDTMVKGKS